MQTSTDHDDDQIFQPGREKYAKKDNVNNINTFPASWST